MDIQAVAVQDAPQKQATTPVVPPIVDSSAVPATPAVPTTPPASQDQKNQPLSASIARLFGTPDAPTAVDVQVSYRIDKYVDQIVTVFTDPRTGKEIAQFPKEIMIQIAQFFDQQSGVTVDRNA